MQSPYLAASSVLGPGIFGVKAWIDAIAENGPIDVEAIAIVQTYYQESPKFGINPDIALAQGVEETGWFDSYYWREKHNPCGLGITGPGVEGKDYKTILAGVRAHLAHICCYAYSLLNCPADHATTEPDGDPRHFFHDDNAKLSHFQEPKPGRRWAEGPNYVAHILAVLTVAARFVVAVVAPPKPPTPPAQERPMNGKERTDHMIATLRSRGLQVIDRRGLNPANKDHPYRSISLGAITKLVQHWTGDGFNRQTITGIVKKDYGLDTISALMSSEDEIDLIEWYARYHISKDNRTWGGIAYPFTVFPSGRIYVNWNIGTMTYHAFSVNAYSLAICFPSSQSQGPTPACLLATNHIWYYLCEETPEIPAGWSDLYGHNECKIFDSQNQTSCPGVAMTAQVRAARESGAPTVNISLTGGGTPPPPPTGSTDPISASLLGWYAKLPADLQGDKGNDVFHEARIDFSSIFPTIQGQQRAILGEYVAAWFDQDGTIRPIHPQVRVALDSAGKIVRL